MSDVVTVPPFHGNINFNAQHAPVGAYMSFTCGHFGTGGGIGVEILYVGVKQGNRRAAAPIKCLPFVRREGAFTSAAATFQVEQADNRALPPSVQCYGADEIRRHYGWASDTWETDDLSFSIYTPFAPVPEPGADLAALRAALLPAIVATLTVDNRKGECTKTGVFALDFPDSGTRLLQPTATDACDGPATDRAGFAWRRSMGVMGTLAPAGDNRTGDAGEALCAFQRWSVAEGIADVNPVHELGSCGGLAFQVPPGA